MQMVRGFMLSQALFVVAKLRIADALAREPKSAVKLAEVIEADHESLYRLLRFLTSVDVTYEDEEGRFTMTPTGAVLSSDHPYSARALAVMYGEAFIWRAWGRLIDTVRTGQPGFDQEHGVPLFEFLERHPYEATVFNDAMTAASRADLPAILAAYDFSKATTIVDVGGGHGALLSGILDAYPNARGVVCDLPHVVADVDPSPRLEVDGRDVFESVTPRGDHYLLKRVLHDWSDERCVQLLRAVRAAIVPDGKVLVMEAVVQPPNSTDPAKWMDINMLALLTGRERTADEFASLCAAAGFRPTKVVPAGGLSITEAIPI